ncbi:MAG: chemotaxis protein CheB [Janthinobacterium lividum]
MTQPHLPIFVAIGASGSEGLDDIRDLLGELPASLDAIVMVVLHRPSDQISHLRDVLARSTKMPVLIATETESLKPGTCYIGAPDEHLTLVDTNLAHMVPGENNQLRNRTVDTLFNSLAQHAGNRTMGIVLSGWLSDGSRGLAAIHAEGGLTMVLDPGYKARGMQQNAIDFDGPISLIGTGSEIAALIIKEAGSLVK